MSNTQSEDLDRRRAEAESHLLQVGGIYVSALTVISVWLLKNPAYLNSSLTHNPLIEPTLLIFLLMFNTLILFVISYYATQVGALEHLMYVQQLAKLEDESYVDQARSGSVVSWSSLYGASRTMRFLDEASIWLLLTCVLLVTAVLSYCMLFIGAGKARWLIAVPLALQVTCISVVIIFSCYGRRQLAKKLLGV